MSLSANDYVTLVVTLSGAYQQLTLEASLTVSTKRRTLIRSISFQMDAAATHVGFIAGVQRDGSAPNDYGIQLPVPVSSIPAAPFVMGDNMAQYPLMALESIYVKGTSTEKMRINIAIFNP